MIKIHFPREGSAAERIMQNKRKWTEAINTDCRLVYLFHGSYRRNSQIAIFKFVSTDFITNIFTD